MDILVIDDEQVIIDSVKKLCSSEGWKVDTALDARTGLGKIDHQPYRIIICDIMMPEIDGFKFLDELKSRNIDTPVIITTGYSTVENAVRSLNSGAIDFLAKPFTFDELISIIKRGIRVKEIFNSVAMQTSDETDAVGFVPCPTQYNRLGYTSWAFLENDGTVKIGLTDLLVRVIDPVINIELLPKDDEIIQGNPCINLFTESQLQHVLLSPMTGRIVETNDRIVSDVSLLEKDPYFEGWIYRIIPSSLEYEIKHLTPCGEDF